MTLAAFAAIALLLVVLLANAAVLVARVPKERSAGDLRLHRLARGAYIYRGFFSNSAVLVMDEAVVVVDTQVSPIAARRLRDAIEAITTKPIRYVINTHYHGDHTGGNAVFPEAEVIATEETARFVVERDPERVEYAHTFGLEFEEVHATSPPTRTFADQMTLEVGRERLELMRLGRVETPDACVVHWPARGVVACGDGVATHDYPYLGVPFLDEGLRDDRSWIGYLEAIAALRPEVLIAGHGPPLVGRSVIAARIELLIALFTDLLDEVRAELREGTGTKEIVARVDRRLRRYPERADLQEHTVSQRFAIYRCINNLSPERAGRGWWNDLRPSVIARAQAEEVAATRATIEATEGAHVARALSLASHRRDLAIALLEAWIREHERDAHARGALADVFFDGLPEARRTHPFVDAMEYVAACSAAAKGALAIDPEEPLALLSLGVAEVFGGMVLAQSMERAIEKIERALRAPHLSAHQRRKGAFFLGKAHQVELRDADSDRWLRQVLPAALRPLFPLVRARLRAYP